MALWNITECSSNLMAGFDLDWLPDGLPPQIKQFRTRSAVGLEVDTVVGSIPLKNGDTLQIFPKAGSANFLRMLFDASFADDAITTMAGGMAAYQSSEELTLAALVARPFVNMLRVVAANSFKFDWKREIERDAVLAGDIELIDTAINLRTGSERPFVFQRNKRTYNTAENRILRAASFVVAREYNRFLSSHDREFVRVFLRRADIATATQADVDRVKSNVATTAYSGSRGYYATTLKLALIILAQQGFQQGEHTDLYAEPVLFNSATVFEEFVRTAIAKSYQQRGLNVRKGFFPPLSLLKDGSFQLTPDIVVARDDKVKLLADAKYKIGAVTAADHYQMHAYAKRAAINFAVLFCAADSDRIAVTQRASNLDISIVEVFLPLKDLDASIHFLRELESKISFFRP